MTETVSHAWPCTCCGRVYRHEVLERLDAQRVLIRCPGCGFERPLVTGTAYPRVPLRQAAVAE